MTTSKADEPREYETIIVERHTDGVATVTLDRPDALNSFNRRMRHEFAALWPLIQEDDGVRAVVLRASGERAFSTGVDVTELASDDPDVWVDTRRPWDELEDPGRDLSPKRNGVWKPIIAAVQGMCAGGAFYWIAECDIVICEPDATFFDPHVTYGMVAALEPIAMRYRMHLSDALRMTLLGLHERMSAERALQAGLVTEIVEFDRLAGRAHELAALIASQPSAAVQGSLKALWRSLDVGRSQALDTALMYTQIGNPLGTSALDRGAARPKEWHRR